MNMCSKDPKFPVSTLILVTETARLFLFVDKINSDQSFSLVYGSKYVEIIVVDILFSVFLYMSVHIFVILNVMDWAFAELGQFCDGKEGVKQKEQPKSEAKFNDSKSSSQAKSREQESPTSMLTKPLLEIEEQSSTFSSDSSMSLTDDSPKFEHKIHSTLRKEREDHIFPDEEAIQEVEREALGEKAPFIPNLANENKKIPTKNFGKSKKADPTPDQSSSSKSKFTRSRSYSNNASNIFRNLLTCGTVDTKDSSMMVIKRKSTSSKPSKLDLSTYKGNQNMAQICRGDVVGGSERISRNFWHETQENDHRKSCDGASHSRQKKEMNSQRPVPPAYRPRNGPNCSQCGKTFDPNQLHKHMSSCRGMKALAKAAAATTAANTSSYSHRRSTDSPRPSIFKPLLD
nr:PREDICTED: uncharacterized protein LOC108200907 isoform X1 [Daucus carota subsp. sativus]